MRFATALRTIVFVIALIALYGTVGSARADVMPAPAPSFVSQLQAFVADFPRWDATHQEMPLVFLATTPEEQRPQALLMLWLLWMRDHPGTVAGAGGGGGTVIPPPSENPPPGGGEPPPAGGGGPPGGGHTSGSSPEPSSLALMGCGSLGLLAYRLVRSRIGRRGWKAA